MSCLDNIKNRLGIYYTEAQKDDEISQYIAEAKAFLLAAGVDSSYLTTDSESPLALGAIALYAKMAQQADPAEMKNNPVLIGMIYQMRSINE